MCPSSKPTDVKLIVALFGVGVGVLVAVVVNVLVGETVLVGVGVVVAVAVDVPVGETVLVCVGVLVAVTVFVFVTMGELVHGNWSVGKSNTLVKELLSSSLSVIMFVESTMAVTSTSGM